LFPALLAVTTVGFGPGAVDHVDPVDAVDGRCAVGGVRDPRGAGPTAGFGRRHDDRAVSTT
jgi:hypothetical protein